MPARALRLELHHFEVRGAQGHGENKNAREGIATSRSHARMNISHRYGENKNAREGIATRLLCRLKRYDSLHTAWRKQKCPRGHCDGACRGHCGRSPRYGENKNAREGIATHRIFVDRPCVCYGENKNAREGIATTV